MHDRILILAAHPDDESIGCGATAARWCSSGAEVAAWFATDGVSSRTLLPETATSRKESCTRALEILGVKTSFFEEYPDNALDSVPRLDICRSMEAAIAAFQPTVVVSHSQADLNVDHRVVGECSAVVCRPQPGGRVRALWHYEVPSSTHWFPNAMRQFAPTHYVDVTGFMETKFRALAQYELEIPEWPHARSLEALGALAAFRGSSVGVSAAEAFEVSYELEV